MFAGYIGKLLRSAFGNNSISKNSLVYASIPADASKLAIKKTSQAFYIAGLTNVQLVREQDAIINSYMY